MLVTLDVDFRLGSEVVFRVAPDVNGVVNTIQVQPSGILYRVAWIHNGAYQESWVYGLELLPNPAGLLAEDEVTRRRGGAEAPELPAP
jgi:hypothetical protein